MNEENAFKELPVQEENKKPQEGDSEEDSLEDEISTKVKRSPFCDHEFLILRQPGLQGITNLENAATAT